MAEEMVPGKRRWSDRPPWLLAIATLALAAWVLWASRGFDNPYACLCLGVCFIWPMVALWIGRVTVAGVGLKAGLSASTFARHRWRWIVPNAVLVLAVLLALAGVPARVAFSVARPDLERQARQVLATPVGAATQPMDVSGQFSLTLIKAYQVEVVDGGVFFTTGGVMFGQAGICYLPPEFAPPTSTQSHRDEHFAIDEPLGGDWYRFFQ